MESIILDLEPIPNSGIHHLGSWIYHLLWSPDYWILNLSLEKISCGAKPGSTSLLLHLASHICCLWFALCLSCPWECLAKCLGKDAEQMFSYCQHAADESISLMLMILLLGTAQLLPVHCTWSLHFFRAGWRSRWLLWLFIHRLLHISPFFLWFFQPPSLKIHHPLPWALAPLS